MGDNSESDRQQSSQQQSQELTMNVPKEIIVGEWASLRASGFEPDEIVDIELMFPDETMYELGSALADNNGQVRTEFLVPFSMEPGSRLIVLIGDSSGGTISSPVTVVAADDDDAADDNTDGNKEESDDPDNTSDDSADQDDKGNRDSNDADREQSERSEGQQRQEDAESGSESLAEDDDSDSGYSGDRGGSERSETLREAPDERDDNNVDSDANVSTEAEETDNGQSAQEEYRDGQGESGADDVNGDAHSFVEDDSEFSNSLGDSDYDGDSAGAVRPDGEQVSFAGNRDSTLFLSDNNNDGADGAYSADDGFADDKIISAGFVSTLGSMRPEAAAGLLAGAVLFGSGAVLAIRRWKIRG